MVAGGSVGQAMVRGALLAGALLVVAGVVVVGARSNVLVPKPSPTFVPPSPKPTPNTDDARRQFWRMHGVVDPPPAEIFEVPGPTHVATFNQTGGAVSATDAIVWFSSFRRSFAAKIWSIEHFRHDVVDSNVLGSPGLDGTDARITSLEHAGASSVVFNPPVRVALQLVNLTAVESQQLAPDKKMSYAIIFQLNGEFNGVMQFPDGHTQPYLLQSATGVSRQLIVGEFRDDPVSGGLWFMARTYDCARPANKYVNAVCSVSPPA